MARFLATADQHAGKHAARLSRTPGERLQEQADLWARTLELAREHECDAILHGGDLFDARQPGPDVVTAMERPLVEHRDAGGCPIVFVLGNHEKRGDLPTAPGVFGLAGLIDLHSRPGVVEHAGVSVVCLPSVPVARMVAGVDGGDRDEIHQAAAEALLDIARGYRTEIPGPAVLLAHFPISGDADGISTFTRETVIPLDGLEDLGYEAIVAGDFHRPQLLETSVGRAPGPIFYTGSPQPLDFGEGAYEHGVWLLDVGEPPEFLPLESRGFVTLEWDHEEDPAVVIEMSRSDLAHADRIQGAYVKARYTATAESAPAIDTSALRQGLLDAGAYMVTLEPRIERAVRARAEGLDETVSDTDALEQWLETQSVNGAQAPALRSLHQDYLQEIS